MIRASLKGGSGRGDEGKRTEVAKRSGVGFVLGVNITLVWFRQDLRLEDNPALMAALERGGVVVPVYVADDAGEGEWRPGGASRWWLHHSLTALDETLRARGSRLVVRRGETETELARLVKETGASAVYWNRRYEPACIKRDAKIKAGLTQAGVEVKSFNGALLHEPHTIQNKQGRPFQVFTPYWRHCLTLEKALPVRMPAGAWCGPKTWPEGVELEALGWLPKISWDGGFLKAWKPGEAGAKVRMAAFAKEAMEDYEQGRNLPDRAGTSRLSPHLHFGEVSPRQVWAAVKTVGAEAGVFPPSNGARVFLSEIGWREFAYHLMYHFPQTPTEPLREEFKAFEWAEDESGEQLRAWQRGRTGYPVVDAGMRELWATGWMHNRVRMIVASFLVKHLRLPWQHGAAWFWDTLVDADLASNTLGWQWSAGCGADAAPYFRIFAPVLQGEKFDGEGGYVRRWVPELAGLPNKYLHQPWAAPAAVLKGAGVILGETYPEPVVDHAKAREAALGAFKRLRADR